MITMSLTLPKQSTTYRRARGLGTFTRCPLRSRGRHSKVGMALMGTARTFRGVTKSWPSRPGRHFRKGPQERDRAGRRAVRLAVLALAIGMLFISATAPPSRGYEESKEIGSGRTTHQALMDLVPEVLEADGFRDLAAFLAANAATLKAGTVRADWTLFDSREHYMDPNTGSGLGGFRSAGSLGRENALFAEAAWRDGDHWDALEHLGRVLHIIQDLTVPHHARLTPLDSHAEYEAWVTDHLKGIPPPIHGVYIIDTRNSTGP